MDAIAAKSPQTINGSVFEIALGENILTIFGGVLLTWSLVVLGIELDLNKNKQADLPDLDPKLIIFSIPSVFPDSSKDEDEYSPSMSLSLDIFSILLTLSMVSLPSTNMSVYSTIHAIKLPEGILVKLAVPPVWLVGKSVFGIQL